MSWSGAKNYVSKSFMCSLGKGRLKGINYNNLRINITDANFYKTNINRLKGQHSNVETSAESLIDYNNIRLGDLKKPYYWYETVTLKGKKGIKEQTVLRSIETTIRATDNVVYNTLIDSFNKDTEEPPEVSFESVKNMPCSSRIFSTENDDSWITHDFDWSLVARYNPKIMKYFANEYNFASSFVESEYNGYGVSPNMLDENVIRLSAEEFDYQDKNNNAMMLGAAGILLTYENDSNGMTGDNALPIAYYDFGKTLHSNYNYLHLDWHEDGIMKVE